MISEEGVTLPVVGTLPKGWCAVEFRSVLDGGTRNGIYKPKQYHGTGSKIVNMGELFGNPRLRSVEMQRIQLTSEEIDKFSLIEGDLIFARRSLVAEGAGKCSIVLEVNEPTTFESSIIRARPNPLIADSMYLYYLFSSPFGTYSLGSILRHVAVAGITGSDLVKLQIPLPPLPEQRAIAHILGSLDDKIELNRQMNETLEAMARAVFNSWFVDFDPVRAKAEGREPAGMSAETAALFPDSFEEMDFGMVPKGWKEGTLADFSSLNPETWSKETRPIIINYIDLSNTKWGRIEAVTTYVQQDAPSRAQRVLRVRDTILGTVRPGNGSYAFISENGLTGSTGFAVLRPHRGTYAEFVYLAATAIENIEALSILADGGAYPAIRPEVVSSTRVIYPSDNIIASFSRIIAPLFALFAENERLSHTSAALRDVLLPKLISGEIKVKYTGKLSKERML